METQSAAGKTYVKKIPVFILRWNFSRALKNIGAVFFPCIRSFTETKTVQHLVCNAALATDCIVSSVYFSVSTITQWTAALSLMKFFANMYLDNLLKPI